MKRLLILVCMAGSLAVAFPAAAERERLPRQGEYGSRDAGHDNRDYRREDYRHEDSRSSRREQMSQEQRDQLRQDIYDYGRDSNRGGRGGDRGGRRR